MFNSYVSLAEGSNGLRQFEVNTPMIYHLTRHMPRKWLLIQVYVEYCVTNYVHILYMYI